MNKRTWAIIIVSVVVSLLLQVLFGKFFSAKISTLPLLNRIGVLRPQAPIVINTQREVRISESTDVQEIANKIKPYLGNVIASSQNQVNLTGTAVQLASDGIFLTVLDTVKIQGQKYSIRTAQGQILDVNGIVIDPATGLAILKTNGSGMSVVTIGASTDLLVGSKIVAAGASSVSGIPVISAGYIKRVQKDILTRIFDSDKPIIGFEITASDELFPGQVVVNGDGEVIGVWDGKEILGGDLIKTAIDNFFQDRNSFHRLAWGFKYRMLNELDTGFLKLPNGALVTEAIPGGPAIQFGIRAGDVITTINGKQVNSQQTIYQILNGINERTPIAFTVVRSGQNVPLSVTPMLQK